MDINNDNSRMEPYSLQCVRSKCSILLSSVRNNTKCDRSFLLKFFPKKLVKNRSMQIISRQAMLKLTNLNSFNVNIS
jgi:hypothetical protein